MTFPISPGADFREIDLSAAAQNAIATSAARVGKFAWGPIGEIVRIANETDLVARFGKPNDSNAVDFFLCASFLAYSNALDVVRAGGVGTTKPLNAIDPDQELGVYIPNDDAYDPEASGISAALWVAKYPGSRGNSLAVATCASSAQYQGSLPGDFVFTRSNTVSYTPDATETLGQYFNVGDFLVVDGVRYLVSTVTDSGATHTLKLAKIYTGSLTPTTVARRWAYANRFAAAPESGRYHVVVVDVNGKFGDEEGAVLKTYENVSDTAGTKYSDGTSSYAIDAVKGDLYVRRGGSALSTLSGALKVATIQFQFGTDEYASVDTDDYIAAWSLFTSKETTQIPLAIGGAIDDVLSPYLLQNILEVRRDGVAFFSPKMASVVNNRGNEVNDIITDRQVLPSSSYAAFDDNWKYMYDRYNDKYRWVPCAGDHAGIYARIDRLGNPWESAAGEVNGIIKNVVKLAWNSDETNRDQLYPHNVNSIVDFPSSGPCVFGDKTLLSANTALSRINVRRLMLVIEGVVMPAARGLLFQFNDDFTQGRFRSIVEPVLRTIEGRRGITAHKVVCDESVNTPDVVQNNQFIGQVFVKPNYSINFIRIDFVVVGASVNIEEAVVGA